MALDDEEIRQLGKLHGEAIRNALSIVAQLGYHGRLDPHATRRLALDILQEQDDRTRETTGRFVLARCMAHNPPRPRKGRKRVP